MDKIDGERGRATRVPGETSDPDSRRSSRGASPVLSLPGPGPLILGHRGSPAVATENTLESFAIARRTGADGVELDVRGSADGVPIVIHDDALDRTMHVAGRISRLSWPAIQRLSGARVPSLEQVVAWAAASDSWLNIELKSAGVEEAIRDLIVRAGIRDRTIISSFDPEPLRRMGQVDDEVRRFFLTQCWNAESRRGLERAEAMGVCLHIDDATAAQLEDLKSRQLPSIVWTVNDPGEMKRLIEAGVTGIITDHPELGVRVRRECGFR